MAKKAAKEKAGDEAKGSKKKAKSKGKDAGDAGGDRPSSAGKRWLAEGREFGRAIFLAVGIAFLLRFFVIEAFKIPSGSMLPTLQVGDHIFVNKFIYGFMVPLTTYKPVKFTQPQPGDVIVFKWPDDTSQDYIKRVVAGPGDQVQVIGGVVYVNGEQYAQERLDRTTFVEQHCTPRQGTMVRETIGGETHLMIDSGRGRNDDWGPKVVGEHELFVMGDNRDHSSDSREWGTVPLDNVKGKAMFVWLSLNHCKDAGCAHDDKGCGSAIRWRRLFSAVR